MFVNLNTADIYPEEFSMQIFRLIPFKQIYYSCGEKQVPLWTTCFKRLIFSKQNKRSTCRVEMFRASSPIVEDAATLLRHTKTVCTDFYSGA